MFSRRIQQNCKKLRQLQDKDKCGSAQPGRRILVGSIGMLRQRALCTRQRSRPFSAFLQGAHGVVVSHPLRMRKALDSIPSVSIFLSLRLVRAGAMRAIAHMPVFSCWLQFSDPICFARITNPRSIAEPPRSGAFFRVWRPQCMSYCRRKRNICRHGIPAHAPR